MLITTRKTRQASFLKILPCLLVVALCSCQTPSKQPKPPAPTVGAVAGTKTSNPVPAAIPAPPPAVAVVPIIVPPPVVLRKEPIETKEIVPPAPAPVVHRALDLPKSVPAGQITRLSSNQWRAVSPGHFALSDSPPSLMEDAIITSGIHARLQNIALSRKTAWQYSSNAGVVSLKAPSLTREEALAALQAILGLDKVLEIRLTTILRDS